FALRDTRAVLPQGSNPNGEVAFANSVLAPSALEDLSPKGLQRSRTGLRPSSAGISKLLLRHAEVLGVSRAPKHVLLLRSTRADRRQRDLHAWSHRRADGDLL